MNHEDRLRTYIRRIMVETVVPSEHVVMSGHIVPFGCDECIVDIQDRIIDASRQRDVCPRGSADRSSLNGLLAMLRRQLRSAQRVNIEMHEA